jgi:hypothetical protein
VHVAALLDLAGGRTGRSLDLPGRTTARRDGRYLRIARSLAPA